MKKNVLTIVVLHLLLFCSLFVNAQNVITLLHVNDTHSHIDAVGPKDPNLEGSLGGLAKAATVIQSVKATDPNVLLLHAGDLFQGDPMFNTYFGVPEFQLLKQLGLDAMAVGNHEFDLGPGVLNDALSTAFSAGSFPLLSANLDMSAFPALQQWIQPSIIKTIGGVQIGIFGMTVPDNPTNMPAPVIVQSDVVNIARQTADQLHAQGVDVVIMLSHLGFYLDQMVVQGTSGINLVIGGHDHFVFYEPKYENNSDGVGVPIFQAGEHYEYIGKLHFTVDQGAVIINDYEMIHVDETVQPDPSIHAVVEQLKAGVIAQFGDLYHTVIGTAVHDMPKHYNKDLPLRDTPVGNLVADAFRDKTGTEIAITPLGLISEKFYRGPITGADVFRAMSYGYDPLTGYGLTLATFDMSGMELVHGMEIGLSQLEISDDYFLQFAGVHFIYDPSKPVGERVLLNSIRVNGKKLEPSRMYSVTVNLGVVMLLDMIGVHVENIQFLPDFEYTVVKDYIAALGSVNYRPQGRVREQMGSARLSDALLENASPQLYGNYPNPCSGSTYFEFRVTETGPVSLRIFDTMGKEVAVISNEEYEAGTHRLNWETNGISSGVYICRFEAGGISERKQLTIVK